MNNTDAALSNESIDADKHIAKLTEHLKHVLQYAYEACDQTVQCPECSECWWDTDEPIDGNWHAQGCKLYAARVYVGMSTDSPSSRTTHSKDKRSPSEMVMYYIVSSWIQRVARMSYMEKAPAGLTDQQWSQAVYEVIRRSEDIAYSMEKALPSKPPKS